MLTKTNPATQVCRWKEDWQNALDGFFAVMARCQSDPLPLADAARNLSASLAAAEEGNGFRR